VFHQRELLFAKKMFHESDLIRRSRVWPAISDYNLRAIHFSSSSLQSMGKDEHESWLFSIWD